MLKKVSDARFREELAVAKRDFPFRLDEMEQSGELDLEFVRYRAANQFFEVTRRAGEYLATNFDCGSSKEAELKFNEVIDGLGRFVFGVVGSMRQRTSELDDDARNSMETLIKRVVKQKRRRRCEHDADSKNS